MVKPGTLFRSHNLMEEGYRERFTPASANLQFLSFGEYTLAAGSVTHKTFFPSEEALLFMLQGIASVAVDGKAYVLAEYDTLYIPKGVPFLISNSSGQLARLFLTRAPAQNTYTVFHSKFASFSKDELRIRHLKGKDVFMMFDVSEKADKLVAGYTFFEPFARSWPPHNHTDQEEVYIFIRGHGSMEVYEMPETLTFVHEVSEGDAVTIPFLNFHPVFSQESPLVFIWCIAGERYWVGDKSKDFMSGTSESITT